MPFLSSVNPTTGEVFAQTEAHPEAEVERRLARAAEVLEAGKERVGRLMTQEMGKTLSSAIAEAEKSARGCRYHAENAERFLADEPVEAGAALSYRRYLPLGPVLAVMPWNFPFWQVFRFAAPAVMAGNVALLTPPASPCAPRRSRRSCGWPVFPTASSRRCWWEPTGWGDSSTTRGWRR